FHALQTEKRALATQPVLGEELEERVAANRGDPVVRFKHVKRYAPAAPVDIIRGERFHAREDFGAGKTDSGKRATHRVKVPRGLESRSGEYAGTTPYPSRMGGKGLQQSAMAPIVGFKRFAARHSTIR